MFRMSMVQRPRFTAQLFPATPETPGTYGFLLGDTANAIHIWPGRGLNNGIASAVSLARTLKATWSGRRFRDADRAGD
jgi:2-polyprenyl-6-methoxyphenol hydroxylase-like FAD-dependent oxidoreductase